MALPFIPATPEEAALSIANKMSIVRQGLMAKGEYLVDPTIVEKVAWEPHGSGHRLVLLPPTSPSATAREGTPFPDGPGAALTNPFDASPPTPDNSPDTTPQPMGDVLADPPAPAILAIVAQLAPGQSWLYPDGRWTGPTKYVRRFTDVKLLCTGGAATHPRFSNDYSTALANLDTIMGRVGDSRNGRNTVICGPANHIRIRHALFTVCTPGFQFFTPCLCLALRNMGKLMKLTLMVSYSKFSPHPFAQVALRSCLYPSVADVNP